MYLDFAYQRPTLEGYALSARFTSTPACMRKWDERLEKSDFEAQLPHGEWVRDLENSAFDLVGPSVNGRSRGIYLQLPTAVGGVRVLERPND